MSRVWPVIGPLHEPSGPRSGVHAGPYRCDCDPTLGQSCPDCDGTSADERELAGRPWRADRDRWAREATPPSEVEPIGGDAA